MLEKQIFRFTLLLAVTAALVGWGVWGWFQLQARDHEEKMRQAIEYQEKMADVCSRSPGFPACVSNEEYLVRRLTALNASIESVIQAKRVIPWATWPPLLLLAMFYSIRWAITGRFRPLWPLRKVVCREPSDS